MGVSFWMESVAGRTKKDAVVTNRHRVVSGLLLAFAEAVENEGLEEPEDAFLGWAEGGSYDDPIVPRDCHIPDDVIGGLNWLRVLGTSGEDPAREVWMEFGAGPFTPQAFSSRLAEDLDGLLEFCRGAKARGERLRGVWIG